MGALGLAAVARALDSGSERGPVGRARLGRCRASAARRHARGADQPGRGLSAGNASKPGCGCPARRRVSHRPPWRIATASRVTPSTQWKSRFSSPPCPLALKHARAHDVTVEQSLVIDTHAQRVGAHPSRWTHLGTAEPSQLGNSGLSNHSVCASTPCPLAALCRPPKFPHWLAGARSGRHPAPAPGPLTHCRRRTNNGPMVARGRATIHDCPAAPHARRSTWGSADCGVQLRLMGDSQ